MLPTKLSLLFVGLLMSWASTAQSIPTMEPSLGYEVIRSPSEENQFLARLDSCPQLWKQLEGKKYDDFSEWELQRIEECESEDYWMIGGIGCSWYCGGGLDTNSASSFLPSPHANISYEPGNIHDLSYKTAWVEGVPGPGIGESVTYHFPPENPRITQIIVVNGYVKSERAWRDNGRVKTLKMFVNDEPVAFLQLADSRREQSFTFDPIGIDQRDNWEELKQLPPWTMRFEIVEVYPGERYEDTAITEIYFDGIDVH